MIEYHIKVESNKVEYNLTVRKKYTFIQGDSGTGKPKLLYLLRLTDSSKWVEVSCEKPMIPIFQAEALGWYIKQGTDAIYVLDEDVCTAFEWRDVELSFAELTKNAVGSFILMTRREFKDISDNDCETCKLVSSIINNDIYFYEAVSIRKKGYDVKYMVGV